MFCFALFVLLAAPSDLTLEELLASHSTSVGLVHSADVELEVFENLTYDVAAKRANRLVAPRRDLRFRWTIDGGKERFSYQAYTNITLEGRIPVDRGVFVADGNSLRVLDNWNAEDPPDITPAKQGPVRGLILPAQDNPPGFPPARELFLRRIAPGLHLPQNELSEAVRHFSRVTVSMDEGSGTRRYTIRASDPKPGNKAVSLEVVLDASRGYLAQRVDVSENVEYVGRRRVVREVDSFRDLGNGVYFPEAMQQWIYLPGIATGPTSHNTTRLVSMKVNESVASKTFALPFPKDLLVRVHGSDGSYKLKLWGGGDEPIATIANKEELEELIAGSSSSGSDTGLRRWHLLAWSGGLVAFIAILAVLVARRSRVQ